MKYLILLSLLISVSSMATTSITVLEAKVTRTDNKTTATYGNFNSDISEAVKISEQCKCDVYVLRKNLVKYVNLSSSSKKSVSSSSSSSLSSQASVTLKFHRPTEREGGESLKADEISHYILGMGSDHRIIVSQSDDIEYEMPAMKKDEQRILVAVTTDRQYSKEVVIK